ncbi:acetolactate synthase-1/2/3 large subunit [Nocardioides sp. YR527]|uniref:thiamine pyrophosphate-binding protein n=1 Tax=Nocardioides sp. YR527 TaxID=1881028 RepID=UPI000883B2D1|nr:thiamine pyrophosphate-binding protein [Nocardioides sp. YR527]SDJ69878.1 acetolactate synthase-1/2/3 large subunit [Nocardioides sp. YR527]
MTARNGGDVTVESLTARGATHVFGIPGQHALGLFDAIRRSDLTFVSSRVENNSVFAADGYARTTGQVGVVFCSTGPGALTALGALQEAYAACVPILMITSQIPRDGLGGARKGYLHQLDDQQASARNVTKSTAVVRDAAAIPGVLADAWATAQEAPAGPVWVEIPQDVLLEEVTVPPVTLLEAEVPAPRRPRPEANAEAARLLAAAERPVILAGGGVRRSAGAPQALVALAELLDAPVVSTSGGNGSIPLAHPLSAAAWIEDRYTTELLDDADVLLAIGTSFGEVTSNYGTFAPRGRVIQVDAEARVLGSNHGVLGVHADAAAALTDLAAALPGAGSEPGPRRSGARVAQDLRARVQARLDAQDLAAEQRLLADLRAAVPDDTDTFWDMTIAAYWAWSAWDPRTGGFHTAQASGGLGLALPAAIGAAVGTGRRTFAVTGDGGAMYSIAELATARQHDAEVTWLVIDDGGYGILREYMTGAFGAATATELARPDFVRLAEAFGIPVRAATSETVGEIVADTFAASGPAVVVLPTTLRMFAAT